MSEIATGQPTDTETAPPDFAAFEAAENAKATGRTDAPPVTVLAEPDQPDAEDDEPVSTTAAADESIAAPPAVPDKPISKRQQQINDLIRARAESDQRAAALEAKLAELERKAAALAPSAAEPVTAEPAKAPEPTRPEPTEEDIGTKYPTYAAFARDLAKWVVEQERAASGPDPEALRKSVREILAQESAEQKFYDAIEASQARGRTAYPDFEDLLNGPTGLIGLGRTKEESFQRVALIAQHPQSEHIQYAILKDAALAQRLQQSDPYTFGMTIAGLVPPASAHRASGSSDDLAFLTSASASAGPAAKTVTSAPAPPTTLAARSADPADPVKAAIERGDFSAFEEAENRRAFAHR